MERYSAELYPPWLNYFWLDNINEEVYEDRDFVHIRDAWTLSMSSANSPWTRRGVLPAVEQMEKLAALCRTHGIRLSVAVYPLRPQAQHRDLDSLQARLRRGFAEQHGLESTDLFPHLVTDLPYDEFEARQGLPQLTLLRPVWGPAEPGVQGDFEDPQKGVQLVTLLAAPPLEALGPEGHADHAHLGEPRGCGLRPTPEASQQEEEQKALRGGARELLPRNEKQLFQPAAAAPLLEIAMAGLVGWIAAREVRRVSARYDSKRRSRFRVFEIGSRPDGAACTQRLARLSAQADCALSFCPNS